VGAVPLLYTTPVQYHAWLQRKPRNEAIKSTNYKRKTPVLASPTQAETASGVYPTNLRTSAGSVEPHEVNQVIKVYVNFMKFLFLLSKLCLMLIFIFNCALQLQYDVTFKSAS